LKARLDTIITPIYPSLSLVNRILGIQISQIRQTAQKECIMQRKASAVWQGGLKDGKGSISTDSGVLKQTQYSFSTRFENGVGTNPEELLAAAHAGCFTMALSAQLGGAGMTAQKLETTATVTLDKVGDGFSITKSHLDLVATIPGADKAKFDAAVKAAETGCPVSKLFKAEISVSARLNS
jgi:osmotically inducible protein OsmC